MAIKPVKVALIGSGAISYTYLNTMVNTFGILDVVGCSDIIPERSKARAEQFGIRQMTNEEILNDPEIQIVVNTTYPLSHYEVTEAALKAGKHVQSEKMMAGEYLEAKKLYDLSKEKGLYLGMAPDTFLGGGLQTCRKLLDAGMIGQPVNAQAVLTRNYQPAGEGDSLPFVMQYGGSVMFDMGSYYMHALLSLLGPVKRVNGFARKSSEQKAFCNPRSPRYKEKFDLPQPNILQGALEFENGVLGNLTVLSESIGETTRLEIWGTEGCIICPDPNTYGGPVYLMRNNVMERYEVPLTHGYVNKNKVFYEPGTAPEIMWQDSVRGIGVADMAYALRNNRAPRCSAEMGLHAMEIVHGIMESCKEDGKVYTMQTPFTRPAALPSGYVNGTAAEACLDN
ncbi:Uncharacterized oxidoreductase yvaA [uncultured Clostridium sp.]|nr:Uncharacterized oxidoreductase yvaA [uncultured Clostridium sp.]